MNSLIKRTLSKTITLVSKDFKVLLFAGPRRIGKTTLLRGINKEVLYRRVFIKMLKLRKVAIYQKKYTQESLAPVQVKKN